MQLYIPFQHNYEHNNIKVYNKEKEIISPSEISLEIYIVHTYSIS